MREDFPHGGEVVEALQAEPEGWGAGFAVALASQKAPQGGEPAEGLPQAGQQITHLRPTQGSGARPMDPAWVSEIRDQCVRMGVPFFFKQWGGTRKKKAGRELQGRTGDELPALASAVAL